MELKFHTQRLIVKHIFRVANSAKIWAENIILELQHDGITGLGEAAPSKFYHEDSRSVPVALKKIQTMLELEPYFIETYHELFEAQLPGNYAAKAAVNIALYDWIGKRLKIPVWKLLGIDIQKTALVTSYTIGIDTLDVLSQKLAEANEFPILKVKLGTIDDFQIIENIRQVTHKPIIVDANEGWNREEALEKIKWLETQKVLLVEQPLLANDLEGTQWLKARVNMPIFADESVKTAPDLIKLAGVFDGINIKLMKCGGITAALRMIHLARTLGLLVMLGCFIESSLAITAAAQIAPLCDYLDLDGHLLLKDDPYVGIQIDKGQIIIPDKPGLGVSRRELTA